MRRTSHKALPIAGIAAVTTMLTGFAGGVSSSAAPIPHNARYAAASQPVLLGTPSTVGPWTDNFNPLVTSAASASGFADYLIYEPLYQFDFATNTLMPWLATSYSWSENGKLLTLHLRPGIKWSNGTAFSAKDVAFTFNLLHKWAALNVNGLPISEATAAGDLTAVIHFTTPAYQDIYSILGTDPVPEMIWSKIKDPVTYDVTEPVGTGPYVLKAFSTQTITLDRNVAYWGSAPRVPTVRYVSETSTTTALTSLEAGETTWMNQVVTSPLTRWLDANRADHHELTFPSTAIGIVANFTKYPLDQLPVREAIADAINPTAIANLTQNGIVPPFKSLTGLVPAEYSALTNKASFPASISKAKTTLEKAGYKLGSNGIFRGPNGPLVFNLLVPAPYGSMVAVLPVLEEELKQAGIDVTPVETSVATWTSDNNLGEFDATLAIASNLSAVDPYYLYQEFMAYSLSASIGKSATEDIGRFNNATATRLLNMLALLPPNSRSARSLLSKLEDIQVQQLPFIPVDYNAQQGIFNSTLFTGWPSKADPYATPVMHQASAEVVLLHLRPRT
ncbi:MAG: ABC transporter substrate-binding protein [Actinobacteria bacterium]|nr:ABC transporter substrate-binding protein [Actinomycetota bacterium]